MKRQNDVVAITKEQKTNAASKIKNYIMENFDIEIGNLQSEIFVDYITKNIGVYYYNKAISDSLSFMTEKAEDLYLLMKDEE